MSVNSTAYMMGHFQSARALGDKAVSSDAEMVIIGEESLSILIKQFPWPEVSSAGEIAVPLPMGGEMWQPQQQKINQQGGITFMETVNGQVDAFLEALVARGGKFDAWLYEGDKTTYSRKIRIYDALLQVEPTDRDWENRGQIKLVTGTIFYHYFGKAGS